VGRDTCAISACSCALKVYEVCKFVSLRACVSVCVFVCACVCMCVCVCSF